MGGESNPHFLCTSYVREQPQGPLHITAVANGVALALGLRFGSSRDTTLVSTIGLKRMP
jgi:hypothetical protein